MTHRPHLGLAGGILMTLAIASLLLPNVAAGTVKNPSGQYLDVSNRHVMSYDNTTGLLVDQGPSPIPDVCNTSASAQQCGECLYAPDATSEGWKSALNVYSYGKCVSVWVDQTTGTEAFIRGDVRVTATSATDNWYVNYSTQYYLGTVLVKTDYPNEDHQRKSFQCAQDGITAVCQDKPYSWNPRLPGKYAPTVDTAWNYYCVIVKIRDGPTLVEESIACSNLVG